MTEPRTTTTWDGNEAAADVAYRLNEVISIYPITPASPMGEHADAWASRGRANLWGDVPHVVEMQSEGGAAGAVHGALQAGALTTTFTASQGLLLMIPNLYKIAGELTPAVIHIAARTIATHALSIFGDHSDVYAARQTGFGMLASGSVQEAHDFALIAHAASLNSRVPFLHFFDGFRTSHEVAWTDRLSDDVLRALVDDEAIAAHRARALTPDRPAVRGTAQNPDAFFQAREAINPYYEDCVGHIEQAMADLAGLTGRTYRPFDYVGHPDADRVVVLMGSGAEAVDETVEWLLAQGERVGVVKVRLYRPFSAAHLLASIPSSVRSIGVLDRSKEPGAPGEPLYLDVVCALHEARMAGTSPLQHDPAVVGGRYGLSSKEFTPAMVIGIFEELAQQRPKNHFTVGIHDDISHTSLPWDEDLTIEPDDVMRAVFFGLGSDGTVGANKNTIKIIGEQTDNYAQGYFVYDSKKSGAVTISHLRFGPRPIRSTYLIRRARFVGVHQFVFLDRYDVLAYAEPGAVFLLNSPHPADEVWDHLPAEVQRGIIDKGLRFFVIDAYRVAREADMGRRINTVMQTCFFAISGVLPRDEALDHIKQSIRKTYARKGEEIVLMNFEAVDATLAHLHEVAVPTEVTTDRCRPPIVSPAAPDFVQRVTSVLLAGEGDRLPVSAFPPDGTWPTATSQWEKRSIAQTLPIWDPAICIQCNRCVGVCPHSAIRAKVAPPEAFEGAPEGFRSMAYKATEYKDQTYTIQIAPDDCTGCTLCAKICPAKDKSNPRHRALDMEPALEHMEAERASFDFFLGLPEVDRTTVRRRNKESQFLRPLFEYPGACSGCGETPYIRLLTQLFGDRMLIANATGCSSIYGGNLPTTPYAVDAQGRGPAWSNSLFEDNAEFGLGFRLAVEQVTRFAQRLVREQAGRIGSNLVDALLLAYPTTEAGLAEQRARVVQLREILAGFGDAAAAQLSQVADYLVPKSVWIIGGDGWAYDIGYGGLDHVLASGEDVNILVLDTEVYSNTGGQASKATPLGAVAKFAAAGKGIGKKDLGMLAMAYGNVYVAQIALGAKDTQTYAALTEAESYPGTSLVIAYSHCIAHGFDLANGLEQQRKAMLTGYWPLYRFDPRRRDDGKPLLKLDSGAPKLKLREFAYNEARFGMLLKSHPQRAADLMKAAQEQIDRRYATYQALSRVVPTDDESR